MHYKDFFFKAKTSITNVMQKQNTHHFFHVLWYLKNGHINACNGQRKINESKPPSAIYSTFQHSSVQADTQKLCRCPIFRGTGHDPIKETRNTACYPANTEAQCLSQKYRVAEVRNLLWNSCSTTPLHRAGLPTAGCP